MIAGGLAAWWATCGLLAACLDASQGWARPTWSSLLFGLLLGPVTLVILLQAYVIGVRK